MNKKDFCKLINKAEEKLKEGKKLYNGVCEALDIIFEGYRYYVIDEDGDKGIAPVDEEFCVILEPDNYAGMYWLGELSEENLGLRQIALRLFEQVVIEYKLYFKYQRSKIKWD